MKVAKRARTMVHVELHEGRGEAEAGGKRWLRWTKLRCIFNPLYLCELTNCALYCECMISIRETEPVTTIDRSATTYIDGEK